MRLMAAASVFDLDLDRVRLPFAARLDCRQEQPGQQADDGDRHQHLDEREAAAARRIAN